MSPESHTIICPLIELEESLSKNEITLAISSGRWNRFPRISSLNRLPVAFNSEKNHVHQKY